MAQVFVAVVVLCLYVLKFSQLVIQQEAGLVCGKIWCLSERTNDVASQSGNVFYLSMIYSILRVIQFTNKPSSTTCCYFMIPMTGCCVMLFYWRSGNSFEVKQQGSGCISMCYVYLTYFSCFFLTIWIKASRIDDWFYNFLTILPATITITLLSK